MLKVYGFSKVNKGAHGKTRDLRVLWALEEMGMPFEIVGMDHPNHDLDRVQRGDRPSEHLRLTGEIARHQLAALSREVEQDRAGLRDHDAVVVDRGDLPERVERAVRGRIEIVVRMVHPDDLMRQPHLFDGPQNAQITSVAACEFVHSSETVNLEHRARTQPREAIASTRR